MTIMEWQPRQQIVQQAHVFEQHFYATAHNSLLTSKFLTYNSLKFP